MSDDELTLTRCQTCGCLFDDVCYVCERLGNEQKKNGTHGYGTTETTARLIDGRMVFPSGKTVDDIWKEGKTMNCTACNGVIGYAPIATTSGTFCSHECAGTTPYDGMNTEPDVVITSEHSLDGISEWKRVIVDGYGHLGWENIETGEVRCFIDRDMSASDFLELTYAHCLGCDTRLSPDNHSDYCDDCTPEPETENDMPDDAHYLSLYGTTSPIINGTVMNAKTPEPEETENDMHGADDGMSHRRSCLYCGVEFCAYGTPLYCSAGCACYEDGEDCGEDYEDALCDACMGDTEMIGSADPCQTDR
jgi:hypothetical protein